MFQTVVWHFSDVHDDLDRPSAEIHAKKSVPQRKLGSSRHLTDWQELLTKSDARIRELGLWPDWIVCSGDLATTHQVQEIDRGVAFFKVLAEHFRLPSRRIVIVPGNHDVDLGTASLEAFFRAVENAGFSSTGHTRPGVAQTDDGVLPIPIDTTGLIGLSPLEALDARQLANHLPFSSAWLARKLLQRMEIAFGRELLVKAGFVSPEQISALVKTASDLQLSFQERAFPIVVCHHPVATPPGSADADTGDTTVLMPLVKRRLYEQGVQLVLQGHRHEVMAHKEGLLGLSPLPYSLIAVSGASLAAEGAFVALEIRRSSDGTVRSIEGALVDRALLTRTASDTPRFSFARTLVSGSTDNCQLIRKVLYLDRRSGHSRVDYYLYEIPRGLAEQPIQFHFDAFGGSYTREVEAQVIGHCGGRRVPTCELGPVVTRNVAEQVVTLCHKAVEESVSTVLRLSAQGVHAFFREEAALLRGTRVHGWDLEMTDFVLPYPTRLLETVVRFPYESTVPDAGQVDVAAFAETNGHRPVEVWRDQVPRLRCVKRASVSAWREGRRLIVQIPRPLPGLSYCVSWRLPSLRPTAQDDEHAAEFRSKLKNVRRASPLVLQWNDIGSFSLPSVGSVSPLGALKASIVVAAKELQTRAPWLAQAISRQKLEIGLLLPDRTFLADEIADEARLRVIGAVGPDGCKEWDRWTSEIRYGTGIAGLAFRARTIWAWRQEDERKQGLGALGRVYVPDNSPPHTLIVAIPGFPEGAKLPACVLSIGLLEGGEIRDLPEKTFDYAVQGVWSAMNSYFKLHGLRIRLSIEGRPLDE